jgi:hypothetical protein
MTEFIETTNASTFDLTDIKLDTGLTPDERAEHLALNAAIEQTEPESGPYANTASPDLCKHIKALVRKGDDAIVKSEGLAKQSEADLLEAGAWLIVLKNRVRQTGSSWADYVLTNCKCDKRRADSLIELAEGRTTVSTIRAQANARQIKHREAKKATGVTRAVTPTPARDEVKIFDLDEACADAETPSDGMVDSPVNDEAEHDEAPAPAPSVPADAPPIETHPAEGRQLTFRETLLAEFAKIDVALDVVACAMDNGTLDLDDIYPGTDYHGDADNAWMAMIAAVKAYRLDTLRICDAAWPEQAPPKEPEPTAPKKRGRQKKIKLTKEQKEWVDVFGELPEDTPDEPPKGNGESTADDDGAPAQDSPSDHEPDGDAGATMPKPPLRLPPPTNLPRKSHGLARRRNRRKYLTSRKNSLT